MGWNARGIVSPRFYRAPKNLGGLLGEYSAIHRNNQLKPTKKILTWFLYPFGCPLLWQVDEYCEETTQIRFWQLSAGSSPSSGTSIYAGFRPINVIMVFQFVNIFVFWLVHIPFPRLQPPAQRAT